KIKITFTDTFKEELYFSAAITESKIIDYQEDTTKLAAIHLYTHNYALRKFIDPYNGYSLGSGFKKGQVFIHTITVSLNKDSTSLHPLWHPENCRLVVFVHHRDLTKKD